MKALEVILIVSNLLLIAAIVFICIVIAIEENKEKSACQKRNEELRDVINETGKLILEILNTKKVMFENEVFLVNKVKILGDSILVEIINKLGFTRTLDIKELTIIPKKKRTSR